ncbi:MAG: cysteine synthase family protein, partial [Oscillospiraceae bacterium]
ARGYRAIIVMPDTMTVERRLLMTAYGAEVVLTEGAKGMGGAIEKARQLAREIPNSLIPGQFTNPANPAAHETATGPEIWRDTEGKVDVFVAGVGTGGTLSGVGRYLKSRNPEVRVVAVEPFESSVLSGKPAGIHAIQGIGAGFVPGNYDPGVVDEVLRIRGDDAIATARAFARCEGLLIGLSGGAAICAAVELGRRPENRSRVIVTLLPDSGERYLSAGLFDE